MTRVFASTASTARHMTMANSILTFFPLRIILVMSECLAAFVVSGERAHGL